MAFMNFQLGGSGAGFYSISWVISILGEQAVTVPVWIKLAGPGAVCLGLLGVALESRAPLQSIKFFRNQDASWMSREALLAFLFIVFALYDAFYPQKSVYSAGALFSFLFALAQGLVLFGARGILAWNTRLIPLIFISSAFLKGAAIVLLLMSIELMVPDPLIVGITLFCMILVFLFWLLYLGQRDSEFRRSIKALRRPLYLMFVIGCTFVVPGILLFLGMDIGNLQNIYPVSGGLMLAGSTIMISGILRSGYYRPILAGRAKSGILQREKSGISESPACRIIPIEAGRKRISAK